MSEQYYYSNQTKGFYAESIHGKDKPEDCIKITKKQHEELLNKPADMDIVIEKGQVSLQNHEYSQNELLKMAKSKIRLEFSEWEQAKIHNETYDYDVASYEVKKKQLQDEFKATRILYNSLDKKSIEELKLLLGIL